MITNKMAPSHHRRRNYDACDVCGLLFEAKVDEYTNAHRYDEKVKQDQTYDVCPGCALALPKLKADAFSHFRGLA